MPFPPQLGQLLTKWLVSAVDGSTRASRYVTIATLSVAETCLELLQSGFVHDIHRVKETLIRRTEAETELKVAEAQKRMAEAAEAANLADIPKRSDALAKIHKELARLDVCKKEADVAAIKNDIRVKRMTAVADARVKFLNAITKLQQHGGDVFFDEKSLEMFLRLSDDSHHEDS